MSFCVECGREGRTIDSLCAECFNKKHELVRVPETIDITLCAHCGAHQRGATWAQADKLEAVTHAIEGAVEVDTVAQLDVLDVSLREEDERALSVDLQFIFKVDNSELRREARTRVRIKKGVCENCSRQKGLYFEAVIQVRPVESKDDVERACEMVRREVERMGPDVFISREEEMHGGWDFYLSHKGAAKTISKLLQTTFGGEVTASSTLVGRKDGKDTYRMTYLFRFPAFRVGSVLRMGDRLFQVVGVGPPIALADLTTLQERTVPAGELRSATKVEARMLDATVVSMDEREVQVLDPDTMKTVTLLRPPGIAEDAEEMRVIRTSEGIYPSLLQGDD